MLDEFGLSSALSLYPELLERRSGLSIELPAYRSGHERIRGIFTADIFDILLFPVRACL